jgi:hypothetical protein
MRREGWSARKTLSLVQMRRIGYPSRLRRGLEER